MSTVTDQKHKAYKFCSDLWKGISSNITGLVLIYSAISSHSRSTISVEQEVQQMALIKFPQSIKDWYFLFTQKNNRERVEIGICWKKHWNKSRYCGPRVWLINHKGKMLQTVSCVMENMYVTWRLTFLQKLYDEWKWNMEYKQWYIR